MTPSTYTMDLPDFIICTFMGYSIGLKWVNLFKFAFYLSVYARLCLDI